MTVHITHAGSGLKIARKIERFNRLVNSASSASASRVDSNASFFDRDVIAEARRTDANAYSSSSGLHLARQLEHVYAEVLKNDYPDNNALSLFPIDRSVPAGAKTHTVQRMDVVGRAKVHAGQADDIPNVSASIDEETFKVLYYVIGVTYDRFEEMASKYANTSLLTELVSGARDIMLEFWNDKTWFGDNVNGLYGVLNYPFINKKVMAAPFQNGGDAVGMLSALQSLIDLPGILNKGSAILRPDTVVVSVRMLHILQNTYFQNVNETVLDRFKTTKGVEIISAWEMQGTGPGGTDQVLVYKRNDKRSIANVVPVGWTQLPTQEDGFGYEIPCYMAHGGVIMRKSLMNVIGYATVSD